MISAILSREPPMTSLALDRLVRTCLAKDPDDRWQTAHDVYLQLRAICDASGEVETTALPATPGSRSRHVNWVTAGVGLLAMVAIALWVAVSPAPLADAAAMRFAERG